MKTIEVVLDETKLLEDVKEIVSGIAKKYINSYSVQQQVDRLVKECSENVIREMVMEELRNSEALKQQVREKMIKRMQNQITKLLTQTDI
jgi:hypothetical protein